MADNFGDRMKDSTFDEHFQLYLSWYMNITEFMSWIDQRLEELGQKEFDKTFPTFETAYSAYLQIIGVEKE